MDSKIVMDDNTMSCNRLHPVQAINIAVILEELSDKLTVIGKGLSAPMIDLRTASSLQFDKLHRPLVRSSQNLADDKWLLRQQYDTVLPRRIDQINRPSRAYRQRLSQTEFSFNSLVRTIFTLKEEIDDEKNTVQSYWKNKMLIKDLKMEIRNVKLDVVTEDNRFKMALWNLQDNLQEHNIRSDMENKYTLHTCDRNLAKSKKLCSVQESRILDSLTDMKNKNRLEHGAHELMLQTIIKMKTESETKLEFWLEKYETDKDYLTRSLDALKSERAKCLDRCNWIHNMTANYKPIVKDDRRVKKIEANRLARMKLMMKKSIRIQAWWRGTMVRKALGPYSAKNKAKSGKKGKGAGGKKAKKKKK